MSSYKVDYSELVNALQNGEKEEANRLLKKLLPALKAYLMTVMKATPQDAEEVAHQALAKVYEKIMNEEIRNKKYIYKYLLTTCRNQYMHFIKDENMYSSDSAEQASLPASPAKQITNLLDENRQEILKKCLQELPEDSRTFITYILDHPNVVSETLGERFGI
ncbi:MAG TPA: sigma-70 family RNA polymerase sigma factor, partial [Balneolaceae bacterium]|nr:sigma-70 family RNA polymerase sigma factor [Balneolaceae bacterium]